MPWYCQCSAGGSGEVKERPVVSVALGVGDGTTITYTANNTFAIGHKTSVSGLGVSSGASLNIADMTVATRTATQFTVANTTIGVSSGIGTATNPPPPEDAIYWTGPYDLENDATNACYDVKCPQGWWCLCGRIPTYGLAAVEYHHVAPENICFSTYHGPRNTKGQAITACLDPAELLINPSTTKELTCKTQVANVAYDICKPNSTYSNPVTLECSLACAPPETPEASLGYPMESGVMFLTFLSEACASYDTPVSMWFKNRIISIGLGCTRTDPPSPNTWTGYGYGSVGAPRCDNGLESIPGRGLTLRYQVTMTVINANSLAVSVNVERLFPGSEAIPPTAINRWVGCASGSGIAYRKLDPGDDINTRILKWNFISDHIPFVMGSPCLTDVKSMSVFIQLQPWRFACGLGQVGLTGEGCGLPVGIHTHSCVTSSVRTLDIGNYDPRFQGPAWTQGGVNSSGCGGNNQPCECGVGSLPEIIPPFPGNPGNLLAVGCPGEVNGAYQNYQLAGSSYKILIKTINRGAICVAISTDNNLWVIAGTGTSTYEVTQSDSHWYARITVPSLLGKPEINLYALRFPNPVITGCIRDLPALPDIWPPPPGNGNAVDSGPAASLIRYNNDVFSYVLWDDTPQPILGLPPQEAMQEEPIQEAMQRIIPEAMKTKMAEIKRRFELRCVYLGAEQPNTGCCGTSNLFQCGKHGTCRRYGRPQADEVVCGGCEDFTAEDSYAS